MLVKTFYDDPVILKLAKQPYVIKIVLLEDILKFIKHNYTNRHNLPISVTDVSFFLYGKEGMPKHANVSKKYRVVQVTCYVLRDVGLLKFVGEKGHQVYYAVDSNYKYFIQENYQDFINLVGLFNLSRRGSRNDQLQKEKEFLDQVRCYRSSG